MADDSRLDGRTVVLTVVVGLSALWLVGGGPVNGDQAVYLHQAAEQAWFERWTHVGYVLLLGALGVNGLAADVVNVAFGCGAMLLIARSAGWRGAALTAGCVWPWLPYGEVDLAWFFLVVASLEFAPLGVLAVACSPTALAGVGWLWSTKRLAAVGLLSTALLLVVVSSGEWLNGNRGVLEAHWSPSPLVQLRWLALPLLAAVRNFDKTDVWSLAVLVPVLLAPSDVPAFLWAVPFLATKIEGARWVLAAHLVVGGLALAHREVQVQAERELVELAAETVQEGDGVQSSWSLAVRVSLAVTGRPDGLLRSSNPDYCETDRRWRLVPGELPTPATDCR